MIHKKGQGAMEYLMTYGWAILVVIIVGVVLWQMGIFSGGGSSSASFTGFGALKPLEWSCDSANDVVTVTLTNGAGGTVTNVTATADGGASVDCDNPALSPPDNTASAGETLVCSRMAASGDCSSASAGSAYKATIAVTYTSPTGQTRSSTGTVRGPAD